MRELDARELPYRLLTTAQQATQIAGCLDTFSLRQPDLWLARGRNGRDLERNQDVSIWMTRVAGTYGREFRSLRHALHKDGQPIVMVHGDTMTTVLGAAMGRLLGARVAHVEAGLRSGDWRNPFPEELDRRATSRLASIHYAPGKWAADNLRMGGTTGEIIDTNANTIRDSLRLVPDTTPNVALPIAPFGIVSLHRFELLGKPGRLKEIIERLREHSRKVPLLFVDHSVTVAAIRSAGLDAAFDDRFRRIPRQSYYEFVALLRRAAFLVTDSGGSQEECTALGLPCVVHRATTERQDGLDGGPICLTRGSIETFDDFLNDPAAWRRDAHSSDADISPSRIIADDLARRLL